MRMAAQQRLDGGSGVGFFAPLMADLGATASAGVAGAAATGDDDGH
eukprot:COSAG02_NODE_20972_length_808_cov_0.590973_1_plen_45_part_10